MNSRFNELFRSAVLLVTAAVLLPLRPANAQAQVMASTYFGGPGDDRIASAAMDSAGMIYLGGTSDSEQLAGVSVTEIEPGNGFVAQLAPGGEIEWVVGLPEVRAVAVNGADQLLVLLPNRVVAVKADGTGYAWKGPELGETEALALGPDDEIAVLTDAVSVFDADGQTERWSKDVGRSHPAAVAVDPLTGDIFVSGDQNTNTGQEPYRSPFLFRYAAGDGERLSELYAWPGPDVRKDGLSLQADSFITHLEFAPGGVLWMGAGSDGGNSVLTKEPDALSEDQDALDGTCFDGPCFGYKGAKTTGMFARLNPSMSDLEAASWVVPYADLPTGTRHEPACGCKDGNFQGGSGVNPGSFSVQSIIALDERVVVLGNPYGTAPTTDNAWFRDTEYRKGGIGWVGIFNQGLTDLEMATMLPGSRGAVGVYRGGRLIIAGRSTLNDPASTVGWMTNLPTDSSSLQADYAGGTSDGYLVIACLTSEEECGAPPGPSSPPGGANGPSATGGASGDGAGASSGVAGGAAALGVDSQEPDAGCSCSAAGARTKSRMPPLAPVAGLLLGGALLLRRRLLPL